MKADVFIALDNRSEFEGTYPVRRLSTRSYSEAPRTESQEASQQAEALQGFATQWRWYWQDNTGRWCTFEPVSK